MVDVNTPLPDLSTTSPTFSNLAAVPGWNDVLGGDLPATYGKTGSIVGMRSINGNLFVHGPRRNNDTPDPPGSYVPDTEEWNGLTYVKDATGRAADMDLTELWSAGQALGTGGNQNFSAVPEGSDIAYDGDGNRYYIGCNYCGSDWAGHLLVFHVPNLSSINFNQRAVLPLYEFLGDWLDGSTGTPVPTSSLSVWPLGVEVPRINYTCPSTSTGPDCASGSDSVRGNKLRPILYVDCDTATMDGRRLLIAGMNLDPMDIATYGGTLTPLDNAGRDDGKYDYLCIMDITDMKAAMPNPAPPNAWHYQDLAAWKAHTTFLRMPPDVPSGWDYTQAAPALDSGYDWGKVRVFKPGDASTWSDELIVGSGTLKSIALHPNGRYLYVLASDQGQEVVAENAELTDGGWHVPHLYVVDLGYGDLTDQATCNTYAPTIPKYRLNKLVSKLYTGTTEVVGSTLVNSTIGMPTSNPTGSTGLTLVGGATCAQAGPYYPGEYQSDPTARTKLVALQNLNFTSSPNRLYVGTTGRTQSTDATLKGVIIGAVHVLTLASDGTPSYLRTLTVPQGGAGEKWQITGMDRVPAAWLGTPYARNVLGITAASTKAADASPIDRLVLVQDGL
jgi:hypothetical protein